MKANKGGRPKKGKSPITPEVMRVIAESFLQGRTYAEIAAEVGVSKQTVHRRVANDIKPIWEKSLHNDLEADLKKTKALEGAAFKAYQEGFGDGDNARPAGDPKALDLAKWAIEHRAKIFGHYAATKHAFETPELRIAGLTPEEVDAEVMNRIMANIEQRRQMQRQIDGQN